MTEKVENNVRLRVYAIPWPDNYRMELPVDASEFTFSFLGEHNRDKTKGSKMAVTQHDIPYVVESVC
jgi:hypothetical protein